MISSLSLDDIARICHGRLVGQNQLVDDVITDTRALKPGGLFLALSGENYDGHDFAQEALNKGATAVLVHNDLDVEPRIVVRNTLEAYGLIAQYCRQLFVGKVIAVTGSNGKTSVKEWLSDILEKHQISILKTQANFNNQIGVPKTLLELNSQEVAIIEAGTSFPGEIVKTGPMIAADVAILTNASGCHYEGFGDLQAIATEKSALLTSSAKNAVVVLNRDDPFYDYWESLLANKNIHSFGFSEAAELRASDLDLYADYSLVTFHYHGQSRKVEIGSPGKHQIYNAMAVTQALLAIDWSFEAIVEALKAPLVVNGRLQKIHRSGQPLLINDCYNASPKSVEAAIDVLMTQNGDEKILVLGALGELGKLEREVHQNIGRYAFESGVNKLIALGSIAGIAANMFMELGGNAEVYQSHSQIAEQLEPLNETSVILIKGSRSSRMEKVIEALHS